MPVTSQDSRAALALAEAYVRAGQKIQAIKELRGATGLGLKEAKDAVEYFQVHGVWLHAEVNAAPPSAVASQHVSAATAQQPAGAEHGFIDELRQFLSSGRKIEAIKRYREVYGVGLKEAKDAVEHFAAGGGLAVGDVVEFAKKTARVAATAPAAALVRSAPAEPARIMPAPRDFAAGTSLPPWAKAAASHEPSQPHGSAQASPLAAAHAVLAQRLGDSSPPLAAVSAESGLYRGVLFVTAKRVVFVADRYGMLSVTEDIARDDLESVEVKDGPFGADLVLQAGFHSAHFSELHKAQADALRDFLRGKTQTLDVPAAVNLGTAAAPSSAISFASVSPFGSAVPAEFAASHSQPVSLPAETHQSTEPQASPQPASASELPARPFSLVRLLFAAGFAAIPSALMATVPRWFPLEQLPVFVFPVMFWSALALGGGLRGHGGPLIQAGFILGLVHGGFAYLQGGMHNELRAISLAILGAVYWRARKANNWFAGAIFVVPVLFLDGALGLQVMFSDVAVSTTAFAFWFVQFGIEDFQAHRRSRSAVSAAKAS